MDIREPGKSGVIIIGAGASGLAVAYSLKERGIPVRILEKANQVGDAWRHRHPQLRLNTHRHLSKLPGMKIPKSSGSFPSRDSVVQYLEDYSRKLDVPTDFGVTVERIDFSSDGSWVVATDQGSYSAGDVVIATGHDRIPLIPEWPGRDAYKKKLIHAADLGEIGQYRNKKVLVVGAGNSGTDVLNHLSTIETAQTWVSVRHGPVVFPTRLWGVPVQRTSVVLSKLPVRVIDRLLDLTEYVAFGDLRQWGLNKHPDGGATRMLKNGISPGIDNGFIASLKAGKVQVVPEVRQFTESRVQLCDGQLIEPDVVIAATGYQTGLSPMLGHLNVLNEQGVPVIHGREQKDEYPGLWFSGMRPKLPGFFYMAGETARQISSGIDGRRKGKLSGGSSQLQASVDGGGL